MSCTFKIATTRDEMLRAMVVRSIVFVGEQRCPFREEFDGLDAGALHVLGEENGEPIAAGRLRAVDGWAKLERIAVVSQARGRGLGHQLVEYMMEVARTHGFRRFKMHAQAYLVDFYRRHGFEPRGEIFQEAGIDHYLMVREDGAMSAGVADVLGPDSAAGLTAPGTSEPAPAPQLGWPLPTETRAPEAPRYVGFWSRLGATIIDSLLIVVLTKPLLIAYYGWEYFDAEWLAGGLDFALSYVFPAAATILFWSAAGATPGKMAVHARIVDARTLGRPSLGQLVGRYLGYVISTLPLGLGFLWVAVDRRKQGWHDKLAGTVVVRSDAASSVAPRRSSPAGRDRDEDWLPF